MDGKVRRLNAQVEALEGQLEAARTSEREAVERLQAFEAMGKQGGDQTQAWRRSEDRYVSEASLREQLSEVRKRLADVEAELVTKQAGALELQFENTRLQSDVDRLRRRVEELSSVKVSGALCSCQTHATRCAPACPAFSHSAAIPNHCRLSACCWFRSYWRKCRAWAMQWATPRAFAGAATPAPEAVPPHGVCGSSRAWCKSSRRWQTSEGRRQSVFASWWQVGGGAAAGRRLVVVRRQLRSLRNRARNCERCVARCPPPRLPVVLGLTDSCFIQSVPVFRPTPRLQSWSDG